MITARHLSGRTVLMSGGSRGIGFEIALSAAHSGANIAFIAKTDVPDPRLPGTIHTAAAAIEATGGRALPIVGDIRDAKVVADAVEACVSTFGGVDIVLNNASAINLQGLGEIDAKRFALIADVNIKGTFNLLTSALPYLLQSERAQVLTLAPPINLAPRWLESHAPYTLTKYSMTMLTLGVAAQHADVIAANCLWPETLIATAAVQNVVAGDEGMRAARTPKVMADAAMLLLDEEGLSGTCQIDADVLRRHGVTDLAPYAAIEGATQSDLELDLFVDAWTR